MATGTTVADCLRRAGELGDVSDSPRLDVELLLACALGRDRTYLYTWPDTPVAPGVLNCFQAMMVRRIGGEPIAYILGEREFWSLSLLVDVRALIPRPDTERLVEVALSLLPPGPARILDLGTGTGAIALALASERPDCEVVALDQSADAVALARENASRQGLRNVQVWLSDWFSAVPTVAFDLIVSNPPYIDAEDPHLQEGDVRFEPRAALVAGECGLGAFRAILSQVTQRAVRDCHVVLEHGWQQGEPVRALMAEHGYRNVETCRDLGNRERVTRGFWAIQRGEHHAQR